jgi:hypothetical protein
LHGIELQRLGQPGSVLEHVAMNITAYANQTIACFGWFGRIDGPSARLANSIKTLTGSLIADAILRIAFEHSENIYLRPTWWEALPPAYRSGLTRRIRSGGTVVIREPDCLIGKGEKYIEANVVDASAC